MNEDWRNWGVEKLTIYNQQGKVNSRALFIKSIGGEMSLYPNFVNDYVVAAQYVYENDKSYELK